MKSVAWCPDGPYQQLICMALGFQMPFQNLQWPESGPIYYNGYWVSKPCWSLPLITKGKRYLLLFNDFLGIP